MARTRVMEIGPSHSAGGRIRRNTVSSIRQDVRGGGTSRVRFNPTGNAITTKSQLRRKIVKGITPPGYQAPNYPSPTY